MILKFIVNTVRPVLSILSLKKVTDH